MMRLFVAAIKKIETSKTLKRAPFGIGAGVFLFSFLLYANTLHNGFALDDRIVITENKYLTQGWKGAGNILSQDAFRGYFGEKVDYVVGSRYRPLSVLTFALEHSFAGLNPVPYHVDNALLYALTALILYQLFARLLAGYREKVWFFTVPLAATLLFAAHPVHTEAVANIKGRDEMLALLFSLLAWRYFLKRLDSGKTAYALAAAACLFLGLMSKENAISYLVLIPMATWLMTAHPLRKIMGSTIPLTVVSLVFLAVRYWAIGGGSGPVIDELLNNPFLHATSGEKSATIFCTLLQYIRLLVFPCTLTYDYYPFHVQLATWQSPQALVSLLLYSALLAFAVYGIRKKSVYAAGAWLFLAPLSIVSNLFFPVGVFMAERFLYMPSVGFCLIAALFLVRDLPNWSANAARHRLVAGALILILGLFSAKTLARNMAWENNFTLFSTDIKISTNSAKGNCALGEEYLNKARGADDGIVKNEYLKAAATYLQNAIRIYPGYEGAYTLLADTYMEGGEYAKAINACETVLAFKPNCFVAMSQLGTIYGWHEVQPDKAVFCCSEAVRLQPDNAKFNCTLGAVYLKCGGDVDKGIECLNKSIQLDPRMSEAYGNLGGAYYLKADYTRALEMYMKAGTLVTNDSGLYRNIAITYQALGDTQNASRFFEKSKEASPGN